MMYQSLKLINFTCSVMSKMVVDRPSCINCDFENSFWSINLISEQDSIGQLYKLCLGHLVSGICFYFSD